MPIMETLTVGLGTAQWPLWSTTARIVVTDPASLGEARDVVQDQLDRVGRAANRFDPDSELSHANRCAGRTVRLSPLLATLVDTALRAAAYTDGDVDPTVGAALLRLGYDRDFPLLSPAADTVVTTGPATTAGGIPGWRRVRLRGRELRAPAGVCLDLGATAKAWAADRAAAEVHRRIGAGVLVSLGGDIATAGPAPVGGWQILVRDAPDDPHCQVSIPAGAALATSSTISRTWLTGHRAVHHILDPRTAAPAPRVWRTVSVAASDCLTANAVSTAAVIRGAAAPYWLRRIGAPARLVAADRAVLTVGGWCD